jgi:hypothetical protein
MEIAKRIINKVKEEREIPECIQSDYSLYIYYMIDLNMYLYDDQKVPIDVIGYMIANDLLRPLKHCKHQDEKAIQFNFTSRIYITLKNNL